MVGASVEQTCTSVLSHSRVRGWGYSGTQMLSAEGCSQGALIPQYFWTDLCVDRLWFQERTLRRRVTELAAGGRLEILKTLKADGWGIVALNAS